jgi:hypothetical protein
VKWNRIWNGWWWWDGWKYGQAPCYFRLSHCLHLSLYCISFVPLYVSPM